MRSIAKRLVFKPFVAFSFAMAALATQPAPASARSACAAQCIGSCPPDKWAYCNDNFGWGCGFQVNCGSVWQICQFGVLIECLGEVW